jgi:hypothetical protein
VSRSTLTDRQILLALLIGLGAAPAGAQGIATDSGTPHFDWFEYTGHDAVYEGLDAGPDEYLNPILAGSIRTRASFGSTTRTTSSISPLFWDGGQRSPG